MDDCCGKIDQSREAFVCLVGPHCDALELFEFGEEILDEVAPFVDFNVDRERLGTPWMPGNDDFRATLIQLGNDAVAVESFVRDQTIEIDTIDERRDTNAIEPLARQQNEAHEAAERICQRQYFGRHSAFRAAYGLARSPPFAPCPWRWTLTMVASTMAYSMSGSSDTASKSL